MVYTDRPSRGSWTAVMNQHFKWYHYNKVNLEFQNLRISPLGRRSWFAFRGCQICNSMESSNVWMVKILNFMGRKRLWNHNPAQSRIHEFQEMTVNDLEFCTIMEIDSDFHDRWCQYPWHQNVSEKASGYCNATNESFRSLASNITWNVS